MSIVYTKITLKNGDDVGIVATGAVKDHKIRQTTVNAMVDTGASSLVINEATRNKLGLRILETRTGTLADGSKAEYNIAGPIEVNWKTRRTTCDAIVLPNADKILLGAIPLEAMDLMVHPKKEEVVGAHGDEEIYRV